MSPYDDLDVRGAYPSMCSLLQILGRWFAVGPAISLECKVISCGRASNDFVRWLQVLEWQLLADTVEKVVLQRRSKILRPLGAFSHKVRRDLVASR